VAVIGDRIAAVLPAGPSGRAPLDLDCVGLIVAPGFIDIHSHSDFGVFEEPAALNYLTQGVTLVVSGNCGFSAAPLPRDNPEIQDMIAGEHWRDYATWATFSDYLAALDRLPKAINLAFLVGHSTVRTAVLGATDRAPSDRDLEDMKGHVLEAMEAGAFGLSTGLIYAPGIFATAGEITELARVAAGRGGFYATHIRNESDQLVEAYLEAARVGREAGIPLQVSHLKASGKRNWGLVDTVLDLMEDHRRLGLEVTCDVYPCTASATGLYSLFPAWARAGGKKGFREVLKDPAARERMRRELARPSRDWENILFDAGFDGLLVTTSRVFPEYLGRTVAEIARSAGGRASSDPMDTLFDLVEGDVDLGVAAGGMSEADVRQVLRHRLSMVVSDGSIQTPGKGCPHPRSYRFAIRTLANYARDERVLTLEQAVHKLSGLPAWKLGLSDRGVVRPGAKADLAVFDLWGLETAADFGDPHHYAEGMVHVLVGGRFAVRDGRPTGEMAGEVVRRWGGRLAGRSREPGHRGPTLGSERLAGEEDHRAGADAGPVRRLRGTLVDEAAADHVEGRVG
jgi:N-acyl-D-amino-acid deacylase